MNRNKNIKYKFVTPNTSNKEEAEPEQFTFFYQICTFPNPNNQKFHMKKFVINSKNEFINVSEYYLTNNQCKKFFNIKKKHEYKCYPVYSLNDVNTPSLGEILGSKSDILNNTYDYTGYAPF